MQTANHLDGLTEPEFNAIHDAHFAPRRHGESINSAPTAEMVRAWETGQAAGAGGDVGSEQPQSAWDRASLRLAICLTPARFWSIYLAVLAAGVAAGLWLQP